MGKDSHLHLLAEVGYALSFAAESGEELDEISRDSLVIQVCLCVFHFDRGCLWRGLESPG